MKKLSLIMAAVILLSAFFAVPAYALPNAEEAIIDGVQFWYRVIDNKYAEIVSGYDFIPERIDGYPVTIIDESAFWGNYDPDEPGEYEIRDWVIPDTVTYIGDRAFENNPEVGTVKIPSSVTYIGKAAFSNCVELKKINIPESVKKIEAETFSGCSELKKITLHDDIYKIGKSAFDCCVSLTKFHIPTKLEKLGDKAFLSCRSLKSLDFSYSPVRIGYQSVGYRGNYFGNKKIKNFKIINNMLYSGGYNYKNSPENYASKNGFEYLVYRSSKDSDLCTCDSGDTCTLYIDRERLTDYKTSNPKIIKLTKKGKLTALKKGTATVKVTLPSGKRYKGTIEVTNDPVLKQKVTKGKKATYKMAKTVSVKQGKTVSVKLFGKAKSIKNQYTSTSKAQIVSKKNDNIIKIKGKTRGTSTVKVKVNGVKTLSLKVKVI